MRALTSVLLTCACIVYAGAALAEPSGDARAAYRRATQADASGDYPQALASIESGLAVAAKDVRLQLLGLKGAVLLKQRDYQAARAAYQEYLAAGAKGRNAREAATIIEVLTVALSTFVDISLSNGPAEIYVESKALGVFCTAAPTCHRNLPPGTYKVIAERPGFERFTGNITTQGAATTKLAISLVEKPSLLTVQARPQGAHVTVDGAAYDAPASVAAGAHRIVVSLSGHAEQQRDVTAHEGKPVELDIQLTPIVPVRVEPPGAQLTLDGTPIALAPGGLALPRGPHIVVARARGFRDRRAEIPAVRPAGYQLAITLERIAIVEAPAAPSRFTFRRKIALGVGALGVGAVTAGALFSLRARQLDDDAYALCPSPSTPCRDASAADDLNRQARARALDANIGYGVAAGAAIAAAVLWFTGAPEARIAVAPRLGSAPGVDVAGRF